MIKATVNRGNVKCEIEGRGYTILAELTILETVADKDEEIKKLAVEEFCKTLNKIN